MATDFRLREESPLRPEQWQQLELAAQEAARARRTLRRVLPTFGPLGPGVEFVDADRAGARRLLPLPLLHQDVRIPFRDVERAQPLDPGPIAAAAAALAAEEDRLLLLGDPEQGTAGFLDPEVPARAVGDWQAQGQAYEEVARAAAALQQAGHAGPYALLLSPERFALLSRPAPVLELQALERLLRGAVLPCPALPPGTAGLLCDPSPQNGDIAVGIDLTLAHADVERLNPWVRALETCAPRLKRPHGFCRFTF